MPARPAAPAVAPARAYASQSLPRRSYSSRFFGSDRTALASLTALNWRSDSVSPVFVSGWCLRAALRKAFLMSVCDAVLGTPRTA